VGGAHAPRHKHEFGTPDEALAELAVNNRRNAALNPVAAFRKPLTVEDYFASPSWPNPCASSTIASSTTAASASSSRTWRLRAPSRSPPVRILASANVANLRPQYASLDWFGESCRQVAAELHAQSGLKPADVDCAQVYDNFTPTILYTLEGFGFCARGESGRWVQGGRIALGGELPINTSGGHTAEGYMQGFALQVEAVRQARGECGERQVPRARVVQYACVSPLVNSTSSPPSHEPSRHPAHHRSREPGFLGRRRRGELALPHCDDCDTAGSRRRRAARPAWASASASGARAGAAHCGRGLSCTGSTSATSRRPTSWPT